MFKKIAFTILLAAISVNSYGWDNRVTGKINDFSVHAPGSSNRNITLTIVGVETLCSLETNNITAYINREDTPDTFEVFLSTLLTAKTTGREVKLYINIGVEGCRIDRVNLL